MRSATIDVDPESLDLDLDLPDPLLAAGRLFLWPTDLGIHHEIVHLARGLNRGLDQYQAHGCLAVHLDKESALQILDALRKCLDIPALHATRVVFKVGLEEPTLGDFPRAETLYAFIAYARAKWLGEMIANHRVKAWFQPIVHANDLGEMVALEALARGHVSRNSVILPHPLISAARDANLMTAFDRHVHEQALEDFRPTKPVDLYLNVTPGTLEDPSFELENLVRVAMRNGIAPSRLTLEIIECESISDMARVQDVLTEARSLGFGIALDDLGAGFSNLNLIHQLRPDIVKLDMDLTRNVAFDRYKSVIASKMLEATKRLGVRTVAEGVEQEAELGWLRAHGVDYVQGYLIARPSPMARSA